MQGYDQNACRIITLKKTVKAAIVINAYVTWTVNVGIIVKSRSARCQLCHHLFEMHLTHL